MLKNSNDRLVIAGDIGGTKTTLALFSPGEKRPAPGFSRTYESGAASGPEEIIEMFLAELDVTVEAACFGIAGPVINGKSRTTNLPWEVSEAGIARLFGWKRVRLLNDLEATAMAIPLLTSREVHDLNSARAEAGFPVAVLAPGTGLGVSFLVPHGSAMVPVSSEGGHVCFSPLTERHCSLLRELRDRFGRVSVERVLSGPGIVSIYRWLRKESGEPEPRWLTEKLSSEDPPEVISEAGLENRDRVCRETMEHFVRFLGAVSGDTALMLVARGGVYLGGGIPPKILPFLKRGLFMEAFCDKGRFSELMKKIPVRVVLNQDAALLGAAAAAFETAEVG